MLTTLDALAAQREWRTLEEFLPSIGGLADGIASMGAAVDRAEGLIRAGAGDIHGATRSLHRALDRFEDLSVVFEAARTREALAAVVPEDQGAALLQQALEAYERLGARPHAVRIRARLGIRR